MDLETRYLTRVVNTLLRSCLECLLYCNVYYIFYSRLVAISVVIIGYLGGNDYYCGNTFVTRSVAGGKRQ